MRDSDPRDRGSTPFSAACDPRLPNWQGGRPLTVRSRFESWSGSLFAGWRSGKRTGLISLWPRVRVPLPQQCRNGGTEDAPCPERGGETLAGSNPAFGTCMAHSSSGQEAGPSTPQQRFDPAMRHLVCTCSSIGKSSCPTNRRYSQSKGKLPNLR